MQAARVNIVDIRGVARMAEIAVDALLHRFGEADDGIERRAELMSELRQEPRLRGARGRSALELDAVGDVARNLRKADELATLAAERIDHDLGRKLAAVFADANVLAFVAAARQRLGEALSGLSRRSLGGPIKPREGMSDDLARAIAEDACSARVPPRDQAIAIERDKRVIGRALDEQRQ